VVGKTLHLESSGKCLGSWSDGADFVEWPIDVKAAGRYSVDLFYATKKGCGGEVAISAGDQKVLCTPIGRGDWHDRQRITAGVLTLPAGAQTLRIRSNGKFVDAVTNVYSVRLIPNGK
jgi:hypothetical protein